ncbi:toprim domain-containing protein [Streptomyces sp. 372A]
MPSAKGQGLGHLDREGRLAAILDVAEQAFRYAERADDGAQRAASRSSARNEESLEAVMFAAHEHWLVAERQRGLAREAHAAGQRSRLEHHATEVISAAVETQRAAGVETTADALRGVLEGLRPATEQARLAQVRAELDAELEAAMAEQGRQLTAVTRMDAANQEQLVRARWYAEGAVPELGWWPELVADMTYASQGLLWLDEKGTPRLLKTEADRRVPGRRVKSDRVAMLRAAGFLVKATDAETSTLLRPSDMGREALYLATLYPEGLHADASAAYESRYEQSRRSWMNNEDRKSAAQRLPPLDPHVMRAVREKPVLLEADQVPQISEEDAAQHADMAQLAQRLWHWVAISHDGSAQASQAAGSAGQSEPREAADALPRNPDVEGPGRAAPAVPENELPSAPEQNLSPQGATTSATTSSEASKADYGPPAADTMATNSLTQARGNDSAEPEGPSVDAPSAPAAESPAASGDTDEPHSSFQEQPALFAVPTPTLQPPQDSMTPGATAAEQEEKLPPYSQARNQILNEIARGNITEVNGRFMQRVPRRSVHPASSPQRINTVLEEELAERAGEQIQLSARGVAWYARYNQPLPAVPRDVATVERAPLPPIDYTPLHPLPTPEGSAEAVLPPAPAPLPADWYKAGGFPTAESARGAYAMAAEAAERAARSTARDVAKMAAGSDHTTTWTHQFPLAQFDENAAAALESLTDPVTYAYAVRAVRNLRGALEEAGKQATEHYVGNVRSPQWTTAQGSQSDDVHRDRVRGIVITYAGAVLEHTTKHGLDAESIVNVLEDAAGWTGKFRPVGTTVTAYPYLPAAENVANAAQSVANALRLYARGERDTVDTAADRRTTWRTVEPRPEPTPLAATEEAEQHSPDIATAISQKPSVRAPRTGDQGDPGDLPGPALNGEEAPRDQLATEPRAPVEGGPAAETGPSRHDAVDAGRATPIAPEADAATRIQKADRQDPDQGRPEWGEQLSTTGNGPTPLPAASGVSRPKQGATPVDAAGELGPPTPRGAGGGSGPLAGLETPGAPDSRSGAVPGSAIRPQPRSSVVREEDTVATSAPSSAASAEGTTDRVQTDTGPTPLKLDLGSAAPYPHAAAYFAAHQALLTELDRHEPWQAPAAAEAATTLAESNDLGIPGLRALLALQKTLSSRPDKDGHRTHLLQRLDHHIRCGQMTMAESYFALARNTSSTDVLSDLRKRAVEGQFLAFRQPAEDGGMELGQYLPMRAQQLTQQSDGAQDSAEQEPETAQEDTMAAVDEDDIPLPVLEILGEIPRLTAQEAAPRLLAHAQTHLAEGNPDVGQFAHIHGRPVYAMVSQDATPMLYLGLTRPDEEGDPRTVTLRGDELATVTARTLLTAVNGWLNASDTGTHPLLDYTPGITPSPTPGPAKQENPAPTSTPAPAAAPAETPVVNGTEAKPIASQAASPEGPGGVPHARTAAPTRPSETAPPPAQPGQPAGQTMPPARAAANSAPADASQATGTGERGRAEDVGPQTAAEPHPAAHPDPAAQIETLVRTALSDENATLDFTAVLTAADTVTVTLETSGTPERDRERADRLRTVVHQALRQHPNRGLAAYRVDFQHTPQVGQGPLQDVSAAQAGVPRERLIAANRAAAQLFAEHLRSDPHAELSRTYLADERQLPAEVQQEWHLGYAPSDRGAGRWDVLTRELMAQGFSADELLHAGLAATSRRGTLIDTFTDRIMFPIHDENQDIVGFSGRRVDRPGETDEEAKERGGPKYLNTSNDADLFNKSDLVFGLHHPAQAEALASSSGPRVSVEGYLDVIAVARAAATLPIEQRPVVGAPMGTAFTERQLTLLRGLDTDNPRPHIAFLDADESGRKVLLAKGDLLVKAAGPTTVTTAPGAKDAAKLWEEDIAAGGDGAAPVLHALEQHQPLLDATVEAVLMKHADEGERNNHAFDSARFFPRTKAIAAEAARYIHQAVQADTPGDTTALEHAALTWAKRLDQEWKIPGHMTATAVLLGPGKHHEDYETEVYEQALDLLAADPEGYFADDSHVRSRRSAAEARSAPTAPTSAQGTGPGPRRPGQWPTGTRGSAPATPASPQADEPAPEQRHLTFSMTLPSPVEGQPEVEYTDRTTAAYALHAAVHERLGQHTTESPEPDRLPQPLKLGTVYGVDLSTSGDDQTSDDPTVVVWLGTTQSDYLRMSYSRIVDMTGPQLLAAVEWRAAQAAGLLGPALSQTWRDAVRSILPTAFPAQPTPAQLADLLDTIAQGPDANEERTRRRAEQALAVYTAGHHDLAVSVLAADDHIWVLRNDGSWIQEEATQQSWDKLDKGFGRAAAELDDITHAAAELPPADEMPMAADLTVAHHGAHEALAALRPYSIGLPGTIYEKITDLVAQMDASEPALRRLHGPGGEQLMNRAKTCVVRILEGLATVAAKIRLTGLGGRLERIVARLRGQDPDGRSLPQAVRTDRRMQDLSHIERDLERRMAAPTTMLSERGELQEQWIVNRARWRARYEQLNGQPPSGDFLPDNGLIAGAPPVPNLIAAHRLLLDRLSARVTELRDTDPHTGEDTNPYEPTADLLNGVAWAYQQRLIGVVPTGNDPQGPIPEAQLRHAALTVTAHQNASPLTLRRAMNITAERADRILNRLEEQQILGPYRMDVPRTVLARTADIDILLESPATPTRPVAPNPGDAPEADTKALVMTQVQELVNKIFADRETRSVPGGEPDQANGGAPSARERKNLRRTAHKEAENNALAEGQSTPLTPSQS